MAEFEFTIVGRVSTTGNETAADVKHHVAKAVKQLDGYLSIEEGLHGAVRFTEVGYDVKQYPHGHPSRETELAGGVSLTQIMGGGDRPLTHPWDQDAYIFPEEHPLRPAEEFARARYENRPPHSGLDASTTSLAEKERWAELGRKELMPGERES